MSQGEAEARLARLKPCPWRIPSQAAKKGESLAWELQIESSKTILMTIGTVYITLIRIKMMMRELMARPGEFVSFRRLSWLMNGIPRSEVLGAVAETRTKPVRVHERRQGDQAI